MNNLFLNPWMLYLLWIVPLAAVVWHVMHSNRQKRLARFLSPDMQAKLAPGGGAAVFYWQAALISLGLVLMIIASARPRWGSKEVKVFKRGRDLVIAIDVSRSMLANDVHPNRLQRAKADLADLIRELKGDRAALIAFGHKAILRCPLTSDYAFLQQSLDAVSTKSAPRGETDIGDAINKALEAFDTENGAHRAIILISDGEDLSGKAVEAAKRAAEGSIAIFTVGLGSRSGSTIPDPDSSLLKYNGENVITKLNDDALLAIANTSGGDYIPTGTASMNLGSIYNNHLRRIDRQDLQETMKRKHVERFQYFLLPGILCVLAGCFLSKGRLAPSSRTGSDRPASESAIKLASGLVFFSLFALPSSTMAETAEPPKSGEELGTEEIETEILPGREAARKAQKLYKKGNYEKAAAIYMEAVKSSSADDQRDFRFNAAASLFKAGKFREAADILTQIALTEKESNPDTAMALGNARYRLAADTASITNMAERAEALQYAAEAYKDAARVSKDNEQAMKNLSVVLRDLPEAREKAMISALMEKYGKSSAPQITMELLKNQREINQSIASLMTNNTPHQIKLFENAAQKQKENSELWIPLKQKLREAFQQEGGSKNINEVNERIELIRRNMQNTAEGLKDLRPDSLSSSTASQAAVYGFWKAIAPHTQLITEDIRQQSNIVNSAAAPLTDPARLAAEQTEAETLTQLFLERFQKAVPEQELQTEPTAGPRQDAALQHKAVSISKEDREKIVNYSKDTINAQKRAIDRLKKSSIKDALTHQKEALRLLKEIEKLLPKDQKNQQNQDQNQKQDQKEDQKQDQNEDRTQDQNQSPESKQDKKPQEAEQPKTPEEIRKLLSRALEREKEHQAEKEKKRRQMHMRPGDRDW